MATSEKQSKAMDYWYLIALSGIGNAAVLNLLMRFLIDFVWMIGIFIIVNKKLWPPNWTIQVLLYRKPVNN